jgi:hypothetical protein
LSDGQRRDGDDDDDRSSDFFNLREDHTQKKTPQKQKLTPNLDIISFFGVKPF